MSENLDRLVEWDIFLTKLEVMRLAVDKAVAERDQARDALADRESISASLRQRSFAEGMRRATQRVQSIYDLQCPVQDDGYVDGARCAHQWWENVLGAALRDLREQADRLDSNA